MTTALAVKKSINTPDEVREIENCTIEMLELGEVVFGRMTARPGWSWSSSVKPIAQTDTCEFGHCMYVQSGSLHIKMDDGSELDVTAGDVVVIAPGHDAWVVGDEPCVMIDFGGDDKDYAKPKS